MHLVLLEDDHEQANWIQNDVIEPAFRDCRVTRFRSEQSFIEALPRISTQPPDIFVLDVIVRWTIPSPEMQPRPDSVRSEGRFRAGLRCQRAIKKYDSLKRVPVILHTVLGRRDLQTRLQEMSGIRLVTKDADGESLVDAIKAQLKG